MTEEPVAKSPAPEKSMILSQFAGAASAPCSAAEHILQESRARRQSGKMAQKGDFAGAGDFATGSHTISLGRYVSYWFHRTPRRVLHSQSYYKFAARLIGKNKQVMDVGCNEGLGTYLLGKECGSAKGVDFDQEAIRSAKLNFTEENIEFEEVDILKNASMETYDAITSFDVIEHIYPEHVDTFFQSIKRSLKREGLVFIGTPSLVSQQFASPVAKTGHINIYSPERLEEEMKKHFRFVFLFSGNDEMVHTGYPPLAHYLLAVGCKKNES